MTAKTPAKKAAAKTPAKKAASPAPVTPPADVPPVSTPDQVIAADKREAALKLGSPAERRADYLRALEEERGMCVVQGKADRVKAIDAEISRAKSAPTGRTAPQADQA